MDRPIFQQAFSEALEEALTETVAEALQSLAPPPAPIRSAPKHRATHEAQVEVDHLFLTCQLRIEFYLVGKYRPATKSDPEEYPEIEIERVLLSTDDGPIALPASLFSAEQWMHFEDACREVLS